MNQPRPDFKKITDRKILIICQARMTSTRLPGKILQPIMGKPMISWMLERLHRATYPHGVILATSQDASDDPLEKLAHENNWSIVRGELNDVLGRFHQAAQHFCLNDKDIIIRVTGDCPLIDPGLIDQCCEMFLKIPQCEYLMLDTSVYPRGLDVEVFRMAGLTKAFVNAQHSYEREHVTPYIKRNALTIHRLEWPTGIVKPRRVLRWCVDEKTDFQLVGKILTSLAQSKETFNWIDILQLIEQHPDWVDINAHVHQKNHVQHNIQ